MKRIMLVVAYDGTNYHGWQLQPNAVTIEGVLNQALQQLTGETIQVTGASRTDAGVHALGNVAVFDTESKIPAEKFSYALNQRLPEDVVIQKSFAVRPDFHPRHCDCQKTYEYTILNRTFPLPEYRNTAHFYYGALDLDAMQKAAQAFQGEHDFAGFCSAGAQVKTTVRRIDRLEIIREPDDRIRIMVQGNGFLYNMVRIIAGTLLEVGKGVILPECMAGIIASGDRGQAGPTAPARGLKLIGIEYLEEQPEAGR
ncbi:MAG: tRNA pseudouridine(38-40) synthase TruA [Clostridiaceae bacterium]|nr:tRNA pseudouridine(38-40) synthase TruA [Clostridiaceae bacterium]